jgi:Gram-negative bacterial TonB protein C-terminal
MHSGFLRFLVVLAFCASLPARGQSAGPQNVPKNGGDFSNNMEPKTKVPAGVILVKGAWASSSDSVTPLPEGGSVTNNVYTSQYFGLSYPFPPDWFQKFQGPPPSDSGRYVLAQIAPAATYKGPARGTILITAQDMFFTPLPAANALELIKYTQDNLQADYKVELKPTETRVAGRSFTFFAYWSPVAEVHWYVLATQIRCHAVELVLASRDTKLLESLVLDMNRMKLPTEASPTEGTGGGATPVCIKDYATGQSVLERVEPVLTERRFNPVPVRIIIDKEGKVKHIHFLSAFPDQAKAITDALMQWKFKPYRRDGQPVEVETGIMFGSPPRKTPSTTAAQPTVTN